MKTIKIIMVVTAIFLYKASYCDVIPENSHYVAKCIRITNVDDYKDISLIGYIVSFGSHNHDCYVISSPECLDKGYKLNYFYIYALSNNYLAGKNIKELDLQTDKNAIKANIFIDPYYGYISNTNPLSGIEQYYKIMGFTDTTVVLHKWKEIKKFNDGTPDSVLMFEYQGDLLSLSQEMPSKIKKYDVISIGVTISPDPSDNNINIRMDNNFFGSVKMDILSVNGKILASYSIQKADAKIRFSVPANRLQKGVYLIRFRCGEIIETKKVMIN